MRTTLRLLATVIFLQALLVFIAYLQIPEGNNAASKSASLISGALFAWINFALLVLLWKMIFDTAKKKVALILILIVIKYGILIGIFAGTSKIAWLESMWFAIGIITNPVSVIISGLNHKFLMKK